MILTIGPSGSGLTFLNWSIVFLRGSTKYNTLDGIKVDVDINPLCNQTAHNFTKDHLQASSNLSRLASGTEESVIYVTPSSQQDFDYVASYNCKKIVFDCQGRHKELFARIITCVPNKRLPNFLNDLAAKFGLPKTKQTLLEHSKIFTDYYTVPNNSDRYFTITYDDIFYNLDVKIADLFLFLGADIDRSRWPKWVEIYNVYRERNKTILVDFAPSEYVHVPKNEKNQIVKEVVRWKHGLYHNK